MEGKSEHNIITCHQHQNCHSPANPVVVGLADASDHRDAGLDQEVLRQVRDSLLRDDQVRLDRYDVSADLLDVFLLHLKDSSEKKTVVFIQRSIQRNRDTIQDQETTISRTSYKT